MSSRFIRIVALALALAWVPMSAFAQACATHSVALKTGGTSHPAMPQTMEEFAAVGLEGVEFTDGTRAVVIDAETFWHSVDSYDDGCQAKALCTATYAAATSRATASPQLDARAPLQPAANTEFSSRNPAPDTPPPRNFS
jgi:hypothetical protein